jgi:hypothetical protein
MDDGIYDSTTWQTEPGASSGDARENNPAAPGFTEDRDRVFRSQFQHANRITRRSDEPFRLDGHASEKIETDRENGWLNVRVGDGAWASVPDGPPTNQDPALQGRIEGLPPAGTTASHDRVSFSDPIHGNNDPTDPGKGEASN